MSWRLLLFLVALKSALAIFHKELDVRDLIRSDGYSLELHHVTTEDGYLLELHRIPEGRNESSRISLDRTDNNKPVVVLAHCIMCSSSSFVVLGPNGGLAYMLANSGYDVWMINSRGNRYSRKHRKLSPRGLKFWKFSWNEQGLYDVPASIDYILNFTKSKKVDVIGYSMGTTQLFITLSERPEYNKKVKSFTAIAPAAFLGNTRGSLARLSWNTVNLIIDISLKMGVLEVARSDFGLKQLFSKICIPNPLMEGMCRKLISLAGAGRSGNINKRIVPFYFQFFPESTSLRTAVHYYQTFRSGDFRKYNFGKELNKRVYGSRTPPSYNLSQITTTVNLLWSDGDDLTTSADVIKLLPILPNIASTYVVPQSSFSHLDFIWGKNAHILINRIVLKMLAKSNRKSYKNIIK